MLRGNPLFLLYILTEYVNYRYRTSSTVFPTLWCYKGDLLLYTNDTDLHRTTVSSILALLVALIALI